MAMSTCFESEFRDVWNYNLAVDPSLGHITQHVLDDSFADPFTLKLDGFGIDEYDDFSSLFGRQNEFGSEDLRPVAETKIPPPKKKTKAKKTQQKNQTRKQTVPATKKMVNDKAKSKPRKQKKESSKIPPAIPDAEFRPVPSSRLMSGHKRSNPGITYENKGLLGAKRWKSEDWDSKPSEKSFAMANNRIKWSPSEIRILWQMIAEHGNEWRQVQKPLHGRTYHQVKDKGRRLLQQQTWKTGRTKVVADGAHKTAKNIALQVLSRYDQ